MNLQKTKTVLVTGATGFVGTALCAYLYQQGFHVRALTRKKEPCNENYEWIYGDITQPDTLINCCHNIDIVFHAAGFAHAYEESNHSFKEAHEAINHQGTINILLEAKRSAVSRFIFFSSIKACADAVQCVDETWNHYPTDAYGIAKRKAEEFILSFCAENKIMPIILRPSLVYGEGVKGNLAMMIKGIQKGYFPLPPNICNHKSMVSLNDLCRIALLSATVQPSQQKIFIVTDGVHYSTRNMVMMIRNALGKKQRNYYLPLWVWYLFAKIGDCAQFIFRKRFPLNTQAVKKLFSNNAYCSKYTKEILQFEPQHTLQDILPIMLHCADLKSVS